MDAISLKILKFPVISIFFQKVRAVLLSPVMSIYFQNFPKNGTAKPGISWAVMGFPTISTEKSGQSGVLHVNKQYCTFSGIPLYFT
jgi:hypothetical protein